MRLQLHLCTGDLWTGFYIASDGHSRRISRFITTPLVFSCMLFGPFGLGMYLVLRSFLAPARAAKQE